MLTSKSDINLLEENVDSSMRCWTTMAFYVTIFVGVCWYLCNQSIIKSALLLNEIYIKPVFRFNIERCNKTYIVWFSRKMCIAKPLNQTIAFSLMPSGKNLVLGSDKMHVAYNPVNRWIMLTPHYKQLFTLLIKYRLNMYFMFI